MDILVQDCSRDVLNGVYQFNTEDSSFVILHGEVEGPFAVKPAEHEGAARWIFYGIQSGDILLRSTGSPEAPPHRQPAWEAWLTDASVWVPSPDLRISSLCRKLALSSEKPRVNGGYTLSGSHNRMPMYLSGRRCLYWNDCWIASESLSHVQKGKGVLRTAPTTRLPYQTGAEAEPISLSWLASNTQQRRWLPTDVHLEPVREAEMPLSTPSGVVHSLDNPNLSPQRRGSLQALGGHVSTPGGVVVPHGGRDASRTDHEAFLWQENSKKTKEILHLERSLQSIAKKKAPKVLRVDPSPDLTGQVTERQRLVVTKTQGLYHRGERMENGYPTWERRGKYGRLYSSVKGCWALSLSRDEAYAGRETGVIGSTPHYGRLPDDEELRWGNICPEGGEPHSCAGAPPLATVTAADEFQDLPGDAPPPTPSQLSSVPTELDCDDALQASGHASPPGDNALLYRLYVMHLRVNELVENIARNDASPPRPLRCVSEFLPKRYPTRELLRAVRDGRIDADSLFQQICNEQNVRLTSTAIEGALRGQDWQGSPCRACVEHTLRHLHMRAGDVAALETLPLAVEGILAKRVGHAAYIDQLCARYNASQSIGGAPPFDAAEWSADFPKPLAPENFNDIFFGGSAGPPPGPDPNAALYANPAVAEALKIYMERELGMTRGEIEAKISSGAPLRLPGGVESVYHQAESVRGDSGRGDSRPSRSSTDTDKEEGVSKRKILTHVRELRLHHESVAKQQETQLSMLKQQFMNASPQDQLDYVSFQQIQNEELHKQIRDLKAQQELFQRTTLDALNARGGDPGGAAALPPPPAPREPFPHAATPPPLPPQQLLQHQHGAPQALLPTHDVVDMNHLQHPPPPAHHLHPPREQHLHHIAHHPPPAALLPQQQQQQQQQLMLLQPPEPPVDAEFANVSPSRGFIGHTVPGVAQGGGYGGVGVGVGRDGPYGLGPMPVRSGSLYSVRTEGSGLRVHSPAATLPPGSPVDYSFLSPPPVVPGVPASSKTTSPLPPPTAVNRTVSPPPFH